MNDLPFSPERMAQSGAHDSRWPEELQKLTTEHKLTTLFGAGPAQHAALSAPASFRSRLIK
jgi:hypothetical protein